MKYFETERLTIRPLCKSDITDFLLYRSDEAVVKYQDFGILNESEAESFLSEQESRIIMIDGQWTQLGIELKNESRLIGDCAVKLSKIANAEVGITLSPIYHGKGYAKEALTGLFKYIRVQFGISTVYGVVDSRNVSSNALLELLGFIREKEIADVPFKGGFCSEYCYRLDLKR